MAGEPDGNLNIVVLMGGWSSERSVSLTATTAAEILLFDIT